MADPTPPPRRLLRVTAIAVALLLVLAAVGPVALDVWSRRVLAERIGRAAARDLETLLPALAPGEPDAAPALEALADLLAAPRSEGAAGLGPLAAGRLREWTVADADAISEVVAAPTHRRVLEIVDEHADVQTARPRVSGEELATFYRSQDRIQRRIALRTVSRLLTGRAFLALVDARPGDAYRDVLAMLRLADWVADEGADATGAVVATMLQGAALRTLEDVTAYAPPSEDLLPRLRAALEAFVARSPRRWVDGVVALGLAEAEALARRPFARGAWTWEERLDTARDIDLLLALAAWTEAPPAERPAEIVWPEHTLPWRRGEAVLLPNLVEAARRRATVRQDTRLALAALRWEEVLRAELRLPTAADLAPLPEGVVVLDADGGDAGSGEDDDEPPACFLARAGAGPPTEADVWRLPCARESPPPAEPAAAPGTRRAAL